MKVMSLRRKTTRRVVGFDASFLVFLVGTFQYAACELMYLNVSGMDALQSTRTGTVHSEVDAIDGNLATFSHTGPDDPYPWWRLDLGDEHCLGKVIVTLRQDCCGQNRFLGAVARAGIHPTHTDNQQCGSPATEAQSGTGTETAFLCDPPRTAKFVSFDIDPSRLNVTKANLMLAEVNVQVYTSGECDKDTWMKSKVFSRIYEGRSIGNRQPLSTLTVTSLVKCAHYCMINAGCLAFDYALSHGQCHLHNLNSTDIEPTEDDDFSIFVL